MRLLKLLGMGRNEKSGRDELGTLFDGIEGIVGQRPLTEIKRITGYAGLLGRVAYADMEISSDEKSRMRQVLIDTNNLGRDEVEATLEILLQHRVQLLRIEDHIYTRLLNDVADRDQKLKLLRALYEVAAADGSVREKEDQEIRLISKALLLDHKDFVAVRREFREHLELLKHT